MSPAEVGIVYGTVPWIWMIMLPGGQAGAVTGRVSLLPLRDLLTIPADLWEPSALSTAPEWAEVRPLPRSWFSASVSPDSFERCCGP